MFHPTSTHDVVLLNRLGLCRLMENYFCVSYALHSADATEIERDHFSIIRKVFLSIAKTSEQVLKYIELITCFFWSGFLKICISTITRKKWEDKRKSDLKHIYFMYSPSATSADIVSLRLKTKDAHSLTNMNANVKKIGKQYWNKSDTKAIWNIVILTHKINRLLKMYIWFSQTFLVHYFYNNCHFALY